MPVKDQHPAAGQGTSAIATVSSTATTSMHIATGSEATEEAARMIIGTL